MKMYASCPICGYKLCKGESGSDVDIPVSYTHLDVYKRQVPN